MFDLNFLGDQRYKKLSIKSKFISDHPSHISTVTQKASNLEHVRLPNPLSPGKNISLHPYWLRSSIG